MFYLPLVLIVLVVLYAASTYNKFVTTDRRIGVSVQEIGNQLKRQAQLIPQLVDAAQSYLKQETKVYEMITSARKDVTAAAESSDVQKMVNAGEKLHQMLPSIKALWESNPEMKSSERIGQVMDQLADAADKLMYARRTLIDLTGDYNIMLSTVPSVGVGKIFGFTEKAGLKTPAEGEHLEVSAEETKTPEVKI